MAKRSGKAKPKTKATPKHEPETRAAKPSEVHKAVPAATIGNLLKRSKQRKETLDAVATAQSEEVRSIIDKYGTNRKALRLIISLNTLKPEQLRNFVDDFEHLMDISGLGERAESAPSLGLQPADQDQDEEGDDDPKSGEPEAPRSGTVSRPRFGGAVDKIAHGAGAQTPGE